MHTWLKWFAVCFVIYVIAAGKFDAQQMQREQRSPEKTTSIPVQKDLEESNLILQSLPPGEESVLERYTNKYAENLSDPILENSKFDTQQMQREQRSPEKTTSIPVQEEQEESNPILRSLPPGEGPVLERYANKYAEKFVDPALEKRLKESDVKRPAIETLSHQLLNKQLMNAPESYGEIRRGSGKPVYCGQEVTVHYLSKLLDGTVIEDTRKEGTPVTFTTGRGTKVLPGLSIGVVGMKKGGERKIFIAAPMAYDAEGFTNKKVPPGTVVQVDTEIIDMADSPFDIEKVQAFPKQAGDGTPKLACLDVASVRLIIRGVDNTVLLDTRPSNKPFMFEIGQGDTPFGLEQSVIGMKQGESKILMVPPDLLKNQKGGTLKDLPLFKDLPDNQILIFEVEIIKIYKHFQ